MTLVPLTVAVPAPAVPAVVVVPEADAVGAAAVDAAPCPPVAVSV